MDEIQLKFWTRFMVAIGVLVFCIIAGCTAYNIIDRLRPNRVEHMQSVVP